MKTRVLFVALAIVSAGASYAQNKVNGCVIDRTDNSKLIGVNVTLSNNSGQVAGTTTDINGKFTLNAEKGDYILELSYIGYETIRMALTVNENTHIGDILMQEGATELGEVVVESQAIIQKVDRQILLPSKEQMQASSDGVSLLQNLQIPRIVISPIDNSVKTLSDESVQLRINGVEASISDVKAINPKDIIRVEYHDQPGVRYNGAAAIVDYIVRKRDNGGSLMLAATNGITLSGVGNYYLAGKVHFGKSSIQAVASYSPNDVFWNRSNNEIYNFSTGSFVNEEIGNPVRTKNHPVNVTLNYNWTNGDKNMLNIRLRDNMAHTPYAATDRDTRLYQATDSFTIKDHESSQSQSPSLDIYYQHNLTNKQHIYLDVVGTYISSHSNRRFQQTPLGATLADTTDAYSSVKGNKYSLIGEAIYEKEWEKIMLTVGARHNQQWVQNLYKGQSDQGPSTKVSMTTAETYAFAEMRHRVDKFSYVVGIGAMHTLIEQGGQKQSTWIARPQLTMSYDFGKGWFWKYKGFVSGYQPSLSELSDVSQQIDKYQIRRGNPNLKPVMYVSNEMELSWQNKYVNLNIWANYSYDHKPIMDDTFEEIVDGKAYAIRTYDNQRGFHRLRISPSVQVKLLKNKLMFNVTPFINYAVSQGNNYEHRHFNPGLRAGIFYLLKGLRFYMDVVTYQDNLWGETLTHGEISHDIGINYNYKLRDSSKTRLYGVTDLGFGVMMVNPFLMRGQTTTSKDLSALAPSEQVAVMPDYRQVLMLNFKVSLDFGSKHRERGKRIDNEDNETGILSGAK